MKKNLLFLLLTAFSYAVAGAQDLLNNVPVASSMVIRYSGENFTKRMPVSKVDSYSFVKKDLFKALGIEKGTSVQNSGINFTEDAYQYVIVDDSTLSFVTLLHIKNIEQFVSVLQPELKKYNVTRSEKKGGYDFLPISETTFVGWNKETAIVVVTNYSNRRSWYSRGYNDTSMAMTTDSVVVTQDAPVPDTAVTITITPEAPVKINEAPPKKKTAEKSNKRKTTKSKTKKKGEAGTVTEESKEVMKEPDAATEETTKIVETPAYDSEMTIDETDKYRYNDSIENLKRELWDQQQDLIAKKAQRVTAERITGSNFAGNIVSIKNETSYQKTIDPTGHVTAWFNYENLLSQYQKFMYGNVYGSILGTRRMFAADSSAGLRTGLNVYFEKDKIRIDQKSFSPDSAMQSLSREVMNSRQSAGLAGYINPGNLGYVSVSINTEATAKYYYTVLKQYMRNTPFMKEYSEITDMYIDFLEIAIDEKALSDLSPGNYLFVLHDMKTRKVDYTDYVYDEEYKSKEVTKTTKELAPDFSFVMETKNAAFMEKLAKLPLKYAEREKYNYKDLGGYYRLAFDSTKNALNNLFFLVKDGKVIVTTSQEVAEMTLRNSTYALDEETRRAVLDNNYAAKINTKKILDIVRTQAPEGQYKKMCAFLRDNFGDIKGESSYRDGMIRGTSTVNIIGRHANGLEFIFNIIQGLTNIEEADKKERAKRAD